MDKLMDMVYKLRDVRNKIASLRIDEGNLLDAVKQALDNGVLPVMKRTYKKRTKKPYKWSAYKRNKFSLLQKARWAKMTVDERRSRVTKMLAGRGRVLNEK